MTDNSTTIAYTTAARHEGSPSIAKRGLVAPRLAMSLTLLCAVLCAQAIAAPTTLQAQREAFKQAYPAATRGNWNAASASQDVLADYPLWPDVRAAYLKASLSKAPAQEIESFLDQYTALPPARELRYRYTLYLARKGHNARFLALYREHYADSGIARLDCLALQADISKDRTKDILQRAKPLWLVGKSQVDECDPVFNHLRSSGELSTALYRERYDIAITARNFSLAGYLARSLDSDARSAVTLWKQARTAPQTVIEAALDTPTAALQSEQILYALERLSYRNPDRTHRYWSELKPRLKASPQQQHDLERRIALWAVRRDSDQATALVNNLPSGVADRELRTWQLRSLLKKHQWPEVVQHIKALPRAERDEEVGQYWLGYAYQELGERELAARSLRELSHQRSYYGFLAADSLKSDYSFQNESIERDPKLIEQLRDNPALVRANELYRVGLDGKGRSEWNETVAGLSRREQQQAALLAHDLGWHSRAIALAAATDHFDDLEVRYPLPYRSSFEKYTAKAKIRDSWAFGIARSESLFMRDIRSSAGAVGLMQLMPETGERTAKSLRMPYRGVSTLIQPERNIHLGTAYLGKMYKHFDNNAVLATAAYNAGPGNVSRWLGRTSSVDARIWIENIPFNETRKYVRRVLEADAVFHWRLTGEQLRISQSLPRIIGRAEGSDKIAIR